MLHFVQVDFLIFVPLLRARFCSATQRYPVPGVGVPLVPQKPSFDFDEAQLPV